MGGPVVIVDTWVKNLAQQLQINRTIIDFGDDVLAYLGLYHPPTDGACPHEIGGKYKVPATQFHWRGSGLKADYDAIRNVMKSVRKTFSGKRIGYPQIGAGLAGGDWSVISKIIEQELRGENHALVIYEA